MRWTSLNRLRGRLSQLCALQTPLMLQQPLHQHAFGPTHGQAALLAQLLRTTKGAAAQHTNIITPPACPRTAHGQLHVQEVRLSEEASTYTN